ncbi:CorA metal ion transporter [Apophysomyces ossiformis]|uniref:CorA metal ion transporter n=1 Tax=Apophysomyces ossiformis TaxID=679940 RepID=A0A8H7BMQ8_9FUNG|nr:CorA metal ion transporter [Apophysomyces ossiformis]
MESMSQSPTFSSNTFTFQNAPSHIFSEDTADTEASPPQGYLEEWCLHPLNDGGKADTQSSFVQPWNDRKTEESDVLPSQLAAKLNDLLDSEEVDHFMRRYSLYGEKDPDKVRKTIERYTFYCADYGLIKGHSLNGFMALKISHKEIEAESTIAGLLAKANGWWIDIFAPTKTEMRIISKMFQIHPLTTEDIQAQESREKCEIFQNYIFISFRSFDQDFNSSDYLEAVNFYIVIFKQGILTFHFQPLSHPENVRKRIDHLKDFIHVIPEWINYALIDDITDSFAPVIQHMELEVDSIEDLVLVLSTIEQEDMLRRIGSCRKTVMQMLRLLGPKADVLRSLIKRYEDKVKEGNDAALPAEEAGDKKKLSEVLLYLGDIQDHVLTMLQSLNQYDMTLGRAHRNYLGQMSIEVSQAGNKTNEVINRLTFFATIVVPLNLIATLFGMNVQVPGQQYEDLVFFFWIIDGMAIYVVIMVAIGKRLGFI